jgi:hypothetical protein
VQLQGELSVERMCHLTQVSRARFYRYLRGGWQAEEEVALRSAVQVVVLQHGWRYDYRRVTAELRSQGMTVNHKRIARIMREDNLLAVRYEWQQPVRHRVRGVRIYLNLANRVTLLGPNQLWVADITYIRLTCEHVFLAVLLDAFSRRVVGWALDRSLKAKLPICALQPAIANRRPPHGVVHHSDQGVQYARNASSTAISDSRETGSGASPEKASSPCCTKWAKTAHSVFDRTWPASPFLRISRRALVGSAMKSTTSRRSSRADSSSCLAISGVETLSPVFAATSCLARSSRWRRASLMRTERTCCCGLSVLSAKCGSP